MRYKCKRQCESGATRCNGLGQKCEFKCEKLFALPSLTCNAWWTAERRKRRHHQELILCPIVTIFWKPFLFPNVQISFWDVKLKAFKWQRCSSTHSVGLHLALIGEISQLRLGFEIVTGTLFNVVSWTSRWLDLKRYTMDFLERETFSIHQWRQNLQLNRFNHVAMWHGSRRIVTGARTRRYNIAASWVICIVSRRVPMYRGIIYFLLHGREQHTHTLSLYLYNSHSLFFF